MVLATPSWPQRHEKVRLNDLSPWGCVATLPSCVAAAMVRIDPEFGRRSV